MTIKRHFPKIVTVDELQLIKITNNNRNIILIELLSVYQNNFDHLRYWHHGWKELNFKNVNEIKKYIRKSRLVVYVICKNKKIIGYLEINRMRKDDENTKYRDLSYWIDKNHTRKGIMYKCLLFMEKIFLEQGINILQTQIDMKNEPSINLMKKLGFRHFSASLMISKDSNTMLQTYSFMKRIKLNI